MRLDKIIARSRIIDLRSSDLKGALEELLEVSAAKFPDLKQDVLLRGLLARVLPDPGLFRLAVVAGLIARPFAGVLQALGLKRMAAMLR